MKSKSMRAARLSGFTTGLQLWASSRRHVTVDPISHQLQKPGESWFSSLSHPVALGTSAVSVRRGGLCLCVSTCGRHQAGYRGGVCSPCSWVPDPAAAQYRTWSVPTTISLRADVRITNEQTGFSSCKEVGSSQGLPNCTSERVCPPSTVQGCAQDWCKLSACETQ